MLSLNDLRMKYANPGKFGMTGSNALSMGGMPPSAYAHGGMAPQGYFTGGIIKDIEKLLQENPKGFKNYNSQNRGGIAGVLQNAMASMNKPLNRNELIIAHVGKGELDDLENMQGHREKDPHSNLRSFSKLEQLFRMPHVADKFVELALGGMAPSAYAHGGMAQGNFYLNRLARNGINGDTELALIGPHTQRVFDHLAQAGGGLSRNPYDGHPQYFSLGGLFSGIGNAFKSVVNPIANTMGLGSVASGIENMAQPLQNGISSVLNQAQPVLSQLAPAAGAIVGSRFGNPQLGSMLGQLGGQLLSNGQPQQQMSPMQQNMYQGASTMLNNMGQGQNFRQAAGNTLSSMGSQLGGGYGTAMNMAGAALNTPGQFTPQNVAQNVYNQMGGAQGLASQAYNYGRQYMPQNPMLHGAIQGGIQNMQYGPAGAAMGALSGATQNMPYQPQVEPMGSPQNQPYNSPYNSPSYS